ncbi:MAG: hypothetical protein SNJ52_01825, partial [Verrucomicrobiia bacterium]
NAILRWARGETQEKALVKSIQTLLLSVNRFGIVLDKDKILFIEYRFLQWPRLLHTRIDQILRIPRGHSTSPPWKSPNIHKIPPRIINMLPP